MSEKGVGSIVIIEGNVQTLGAMVRERPEDGNVLYSYARALYGEKNYKDAENYLVQVFELNNKANFGGITICHDIGLALAKQVAEGNHELADKARKQFVLAVTEFAEFNRSLTSLFAHCMSGYPKRGMDFYGMARNTAEAGNDNVALQRLSLYKSIFVDSKDQPDPHHDYSAFLSYVAPKV